MTCWIESSGNLGIATTSPVAKLQVGVEGDGSTALANAWDLLSSIQYKKDIKAFDSSDYHQVLEQLQDTDVVRYRFINDENGTQHIGIIAENSTAGILSPDGLAVSLGDYSAFLLAAVKAQQAQIEELRRELELLRSGK